MSRGRLLPLLALLCFGLHRLSWVSPRTSLPRTRTSRTPTTRRAEEEETLPEAQPAEAEALTEDWRAFRARLVQQEGSEGSEGSEENSEKDKWAYELPIIEQGAILLSEPNDHFCVNQQYFHKNVIFLVDHQPDFTKGVILNRPTAYRTLDLETSLKFDNFSHEGVDDWNVWCGGDCQGINSRGRIPPEYSVLHGLERLEDVSQTITKGVYAISLEDAKALVKEGKADKDDFLLLVGYCGWSAGQLQSELNRQDTWTMASVEPGLLLGQLREEQAELRRRIAKAQEGDVFTAADVGDGLMMWERLFERLGSKYQAKLEDFKAGGENDHSDEMLRRWINRCLIPTRYSPEAAEPQDVVERVLQSLKEDVVEGSVLWGSATSWLLGKPFEDERLSRLPPAQYFHKAVLLVIKNEKDDGVTPSLLALLNGPIDRRSQERQIYWAGPQGSNYIYKVVEESNFEGSFRGFTILPSGMLETFIEVGALEKSSASITEILNAEVRDRWTVAGGKVETLQDAQTAQLADKQRLKWFSRFEGIELEDLE